MAGRPKKIAEETLTPEPIQPVSVQQQAAPPVVKSAQPQLSNPFAASGVWILNTNTGLKQYLSHKAYRRVAHLSYIQKLS